MPINLESERNSMIGLPQDISFSKAQMQKSGLNSLEMIKRIERAEKVAHLSPLKFTHRAPIPPTNLNMDREERELINRG